MAASVTLLQGRVIRTLWWLEVEATATEEQEEKRKPYLRNRRMTAILREEKGIIKPPKSQEMLENFVKTR